MLRGNLSHWETDGLFGSDDDTTPVMEYFGIKEYGLDTNVAPISISDKKYQIAKDISIYGYINPNEFAWHVVSNTSTGYYKMFDLLGLIPGTTDNGIYPGNILSDAINYYCNKTGIDLNRLKTNWSADPSYVLEIAFYNIKHKTNNPGIAKAVVNALKLYYSIGMDHRDISITLGVSEQSVRWLLDTGLRLMAQSIIR